MCLYFNSNVSNYINIGNHSLIYTLWGGTVMLHPICLYCSLILFSFYYLKLQINVTCSLQSLVYLSFMALLLGCLWGSQSLAWGYFWVNDYIEWFLFILCSLVVLLYHTKFVSKRIVYSNIIYYILFLLLLYIRLDLLPTRHSFFNTTITNYLISYLYLFFYFVGLFFNNFNIVGINLYWVCLLLGWYFIFLVKLIFLIIYIYICISYFFYFIGNYTKIFHFFFFNCCYLWCMYFLIFITFYQFTDYLLVNFIFYYKQYYLNFKSSVYFIDNLYLDLVNFQFNFIFLDLQLLYYFILNSILLSSIFFIEIYIYIFFLNFNKNE